MAIHTNASSKSSKPAATTKAVAAPAADRWTVKLLKYEGRIMAYLGVLSYPVEARLSEAEAEAVKAAFDPNRKSFRFQLFWPGHPLHGEGRAWYYLADVDGKGDIPEVEAMVEKALAGRKAKPAAKVMTAAEQRAATRAKAEAQAVAPKASAKAKAPAKKEVKPARKSAIVL